MHPFAEPFDASTTTRCRWSGRGSYIRGVMRADPDVQQYARAILKLAEKLAKQEQQDRGKAA